MSVLITNDEYDYFCAMQWQPIDTAPMDGTKFLAWFADGDGHSIIYWGNWGHDHEGSWVQSLPGLGSDSGYNLNTFSHWMPLPPPPKKEKE